MYFNCRSRSTNNWSYGGKRGVEINGKRFTLKNTISCLSCFFAPSTKLWFFSFIRNPPQFYRIDVLILSLRSCELFQILRYLQVVLAACNTFHTGAPLRVTKFPRVTPVHLKEKSMVDDHHSERNNPLIYCSTFK